ncbi:MAG: hypothetical protein QME96_04950, partial [Myxococcota bacterium]|nr:hypothetical protein [Myxococcota bacterium]
MRAIRLRNILADRANPAEEYYTYRHIVESRRVNGKPRPVPIAYLGKADDLLARLMRADAIEIRSRSHGAVAAVWAMAGELDLPGTIDRHLQEGGRRLRLGCIPPTGETRGAATSGCG